MAFDREDAELERLIEEAKEELDEGSVESTKTILVLGAGASHGSQFADGPARPPLVRDFFRCAKTLGVFDSADFEPLWKFVDAEMGLAKERLIDLEARGYANIEQLYSLIQGVEDDGPHRRLMERLLYEVLTAATQPYKTKSCGYHDMILRRLEPELISEFQL